MRWVCTTEIALGRSPLEHSGRLIFQFSHHRTKNKDGSENFLLQMHWWESSFSYSLLAEVSHTVRKGLGKQLRRKSREERKGETLLVKKGY